MTDMKFAIATMLPGVNAEVSAHGARARYYLLYDDRGNLQQQVSNPFADIARGAAVPVAALLADRGVTLLAAGDFGPRFITELRARGIDQVRQTGSVETARQLLAARAATADQCTETLNE
jgi:predicted Fe-Mo cluster-binding NifX family protein